MRGYLLGAALAVVPSVVGAQGWVMPRPCVMPLEDRVRPAMPVRACDAEVVRVRSDVRAELVGNGASRVVRYEVEERFVNNGGRIGEADYMFTLPKVAAFQDLKLSIDGQLVAGETMSATDARRIYEDIVRRQRDPALVEWMGFGLLRARIFPINPGEEKRVVVRFDVVAPREGDAIRVDYFRAASTGAGTQRFLLHYTPRPELGPPYSPTHELDVADRDGSREVSVRGDARDVTLLIPVRRSAAASIAMLPHAPGG